MTNDPFSWLPDRNPIDADARDAVEQNEAMIAEAARIHREKCRLFFEVLGSGRGPELLELLRMETIELDLMAVSPVIGNAVREMGVNPSEWAYHRNGQNSVVRYMEALAREGSRPEPEGNANA